MKTYLRKYKVNCKLKDNGENSDDEVLFYNPHLRNKLIEKGRWNNGCCFNYALDEYNIYYLEDSYEYLQDLYKKIPISQAQQGDIIVYFDVWGELTHFAKIHNTNGTIKNTTIRSKWGQLGIYETKIDELPEQYGCICEIWTLKN